LCSHLQIYLIIVSLVASKDHSKVGCPGVVFGGSIKIEFDKTIWRGGPMSRVFPNGVIPRSRRQALNWVEFPIPEDALFLNWAS
jgi:hypothetical protein